MFLEKLNSISSRIADARALALVDKDGITVESVSSDPDIDLEALAAELVLQARSMTDNHRELGAGPVQHLSVAADEGTLMVSSLTQDFYLLLVLGQEGIHGQARFELRRAVLSLGPEL